MGTLGYTNNQLYYVCQNLPITDHQSNIDVTLICHAVLEH